MDRMSEDKAPEKAIDHKLMETAKRVLDKACPDYFIVYGDDEGIGWGGNANRTWTIGALRRALIQMEQKEKLEAIKDWNKEEQGE